jgi:hypothetical protein
LEIIDQIKTVIPSITIYLTIHDYQWLFDNKPFNTIENCEDAVKYYVTHNKQYTTLLFDKVDRIFIPTQRI